MKTVTFKPLLAATGLALGLGLASGSAFAVLLPQFQVDPTFDGNYTDAFYATSINGDSSERLTVDSGAHTLSTTFGYMAFSGFSNSGPLGTTGTLPAIDTGLGTQYQLYLTYNLVAHWNGDGTFGGAGSSYTLTGLNFSVFRDDGLLNAALRTSFTQATLSNDASIGQNGDDVLLGSGSLVLGTAGIDPLGGAYLNSTTTYANTAAGNLFFFYPSPFYSLAFNAFNNTSQGVQIGTDFIAINAAGLVDFNSVPEPASLALLGVGLMGMGVSLRKRKAA